MQFVPELFHICIFLPISAGVGDDQILLPSGQAVIHLLARHDSLLPVIKTVTNLGTARDGIVSEMVDASLPSLGPDSGIQTSYSPVEPPEKQASPCQEQWGNANNSLEGVCEEGRRASGPKEGLTPSAAGPGKCFGLEQRPVLKPPELKKQISRFFGSSAVLEPGVLFVVGSALSLAGCPPWHARFSEIYFLGPFCRVTKKCFESALGRFMQTNQRFGA